MKMKSFRIEEIKRRPLLVLNSAEKSPVIITHRDRNDLILMTKEKYDRMLKK